VLITRSQTARARDLGEIRLEVSRQAAGVLLKQEQANYRGTAYRRATDDRRNLAPPGRYVLTIVDAFGGQTKSGLRCVKLRLIISRTEYPMQQLATLVLPYTLLLEHHAPLHDPDPGFIARKLAAWLHAVGLPPKPAEQRRSEPVMGGAYRQARVVVTAPRPVVWTPDDVLAKLFRFKGATFGAHVSIREPKPGLFFNEIDPLSPEEYAQWQNKQARDVSPGSPSTGTGYPPWSPEKGSGGSS